MRDLAFFLFGSVFGALFFFAVLSMQSRYQGGWTGSDGNTYKIIKVE